MMYKKILTLSMSFGTLLTSVPTLAQSPSQTQPQAQTKVQVQAQVKSVETAKQSNLNQTEQRLEDLIKAAAAQNLLEVRRSETDIPAAQPTANTVIEKHQPNISCSTEDLFAFPQETRAENYNDILILKKAMTTGPEQVDKHKAQMLAQAYLGLGFADEAINIAEHLQVAEQSAITAMAHLIRGTTNSTHRKTIKMNADCFGSAQIWQKLAQPNYEIFTDADFVYLRELPEQLGEILGLQLAMKAVQNKDLETAQMVYDGIQSQTEDRESYNPALSPYMQSDGVSLLGALLALDKDNTKENAYNQSRGLSLLKSIAERDGPYRAQALQALVIAGQLYPEYIQDLDSVTQTFSTTPSGQQAQAQKINFLAEKHQFTNAVTLTKDNFVLGSNYYAQSVIVISREMLLALRSTETNLQLGALNTLIAEADFFADLTDAGPLLYAGVKACTNLGLAEFAPKILPVHLWTELDDTTLTLLALHKVRPEHFRFPQHIFETHAFKALELRKAFDNKNPGKALTILNAYPNAAPLQTSFVQAAWDNGYWSLAQNGLRKNTDGQVSNHLKLATTLSVMSPVLINENLSDGLRDQQALQSYLDDDLKIIRSYLLPNGETISGAKNG